MASGTGGIDLLSVYNDEEEEEEEEEEEVQVAPPATSADPVAGAGSADDVDGGTRAALQDLSFEATPPHGFPRSPPVDDAMDYETLRSPVARSPTPPPLLPSQLQASPLPAISPSPPLLTSSSLPEPLDSQRMRTGSLAIVDYEHDETAMSPEPEEGEISSNGRLMLGAEVQVPDDDRTPPGTVHILMPNTQLEPLQPSDLSEQPRSENGMPMDVTGSVTEVTQVEDAVVSMEVQKDDPLSSFLPPPPSTECPTELQEKINKFLAYKRCGKSFNADLRNRKDYRNPDFLQHAVRYQDIDQIGTCFSKDVFDPHGYDKSDYVDEIENEMRREMERKEQERKKSQKVDFVAGGTQTATVVPSLNINTQNSASVAVAALAVLPPVPTTVDATTRDGRQNKKTKWDKVDGDIKSSTLSGGHDNPSTTSVHAALLSAANAGAGYTAFAQQKRREAEEKKVGDRKFDKRS
uniref:Transcriptional regulator family protein n=1 Tax=Musa acuminata subsp. malaccensis TaxID=214687 RepID=A0A804HLV3_MUSAM|nr:PREDICTED: uncharacterized protein LOC103978373 isoform X1 [Musa acuminata subsp. malaccensis]